MVRIDGEIVIDRPPAEVFDFVVDERNEPSYNPRMVAAEKLSPGPIGLGTRFRAEAGARGRTVGMAVEITAFERPRRFASSIRMAAADIQGALSFEPHAGGTRMRWAWEVRPRGWYRLLAPVIARSGRRQEQATWAGLKRFLEARRDVVAWPR
jgi:hypothetical protein